ncbi:MAG TPA: PadR family transcriptional regulator [Armatimonadota bacterium]|jgi:DNA-binding PadR family transcriptional regulator
MTATTTDGPLELTPAAYQILLALAPEERHGYAILQEVREQTDGRMRLGPATLYRTLKRMLEQGLIGECEERPDPAMDDERRRYYRLTRQGVRAAEQESRRLESLVALARSRRLLRPDDGGQLVEEGL